MMRLTLIGLAASLLLLVTRPNKELSVRDGELGIWDRDTGHVTRLLKGDLASRAVGFPQFPPVWLRDHCSLLVLTRSKTDSSSEVRDNTHRFTGRNSEQSTVHVLSAL